MREHANTRRAFHVVSSSFAAASIDVRKVAPPIESFKRSDGRRSAKSIGTISIAILSATALVVLTFDVCSYLKRRRATRARKMERAAERKASKNRAATAVEGTRETSESTYSVLNGKRLPFDESCPSPLASVDQLCSLPAD